MVHRLGVGLPLHPDLEFLELVRGLIEDDADFYEVNPETLWKVDRGVLARNDFHALFQEIRARSGKPFVAHGLAFSLGTSLEGPAERARTDAWLERLRDDHAAFRFEWLTEHLGWTGIDGLEAVLPLPLPFGDDAVRAVSARMRLLGAVVPVVGFENNVDYFTLGDPASWPDFINRLCGSSSCGLLLDLHNLHTQALNQQQDPVELLGRLDLDRVFEIHVSGGSESEPGWLPSGRVYRLDSHDGAVPEPVWGLLERALPRCRNLRGIVVERLNGTFEDGDLDLYRGELRRAKELFPMLSDLQRLLQRALSSDAPLEILRAGAAGLSDADRAALDRVDSDGFVLTSLLVRKLRFEKLCRGDEALEVWFDREPARFSELFGAYNREVPPTEVFPRQEAAAFRAWALSKGVGIEPFGPPAVESRHA